MERTRRERGRRHEKNITQLIYLSLYTNMVDDVQKNKQTILRWRKQSMKLLTSYYWLSQTELNWTSTQLAINLSNHLTSSYLYSNNLPGFLVAKFNAMFQVVSIQVHPTFPCVTLSIRSSAPVRHGGRRAGAGLYRRRRDGDGHRRG